MRVLELKEDYEKYDSLFDGSKESLTKMAKTMEGDGIDPAEVDHYVSSFGSKLEEGKEIAKLSNNDWSYKNHMDKACEAYRKLAGAHLHEEITDQLDDWALGWISHDYNVPVDQLKSYMTKGE